MKNVKNILWGLVLVAVGVILGLNALNITDVDVLFDGWWTLFIIVPCFIDFITETHKMGSIIGIIIGALLLASCQGFLEFGLIMRLVIPIILVILGITCIFKNLIGNKVKQKIKELNQTKDVKEYTATFSGQELDFSNQDFKGCTVSAIFGGATLNLKEAKIKENVVINATAIFGGIDILVPEDVSIKINSNSIFGGIDQKKKNGVGKFTIYINGTCIFGGVDIK